MSQAKTDCETLANSVVPFAQQCLRRYGGFHPFGGAMTPSGELVSVAGHHDEENPQTEEIIRLLNDAFARGAGEQKYKATALVYDVRTKLPSSDETSDAIAVSLNHRDNYSMIAFFPYTLKDTKLAMSNPFFRSGDANIFAG